ncbi:MAG: DMT family transporter, partial [Erythrobacter sp.]
GLRLYVEAAGHDRVGIGNQAPNPTATAPRLSAGSVALLAALAILAFAGNSILARAALAGGGIDAAAFSLVRLAAGALVLAPLLIRSEGRWSLSGGASLFVYVAMFSWAFVELPTATGTLILFAVVQATVLLGGVARGERIRSFGWTGLVVSLTGLAVLLVPQVEGGRLLPSLFMAVSGIAWGAYTMIGRGAAAPGVHTARSFAIGALLALPLLALSAEMPRADGFALAALSGAVTSGLGYVVWNRVSPALGLATLATVQLATPLVAALGGVALLGETVTRELVISGALIVAGIAMTLRR